MHTAPWYLLLPLAAALIYSVASLFLKQALTDGAHPMACFHINNWACGLTFIPLALMEKQAVQWHQAWIPALIGVLFFSGGWFTFVAMQRGDVSLITPLLGSKVVFVAAGSALLLAEGIPGLMWAAAVLTTAGIYLMSATDIRTPRGSRLAGPVVMALVSAAFFALSDILVQRWAPGFGPAMFLAVMSATVGLLSVLAMSGGLRRPPMAWSRAIAWSVAGSVLIATQMVLMGLALAKFHDAIGVNVVYATRGMWSLMVVAFIGPLIGNRERHDSGRAYGLRVIAGALLLAGVVFAVLARR